MSEPTPVSDRSRGVTLGLAVVGGFFGLHRFYAGRVESGVWMCLTLGGTGSPGPMRRDRLSSRTIARYFLAPANAVRVTSPWGSR